MRLPSYQRAADIIGIPTFATETPRGAERHKIQDDLVKIVEYLMRLKFAERHFITGDIEQARHQRRLT